MKLKKISPLRKKRQALAEMDRSLYGLENAASNLGIDKTTLTRIEHTGDCSKNMAALLADYFDLHEAEILYPHRYLSAKPCLYLANGTAITVRELFAILHKWERTGKPVKL